VVVVKGSIERLPTPQRKIIFNNVKREITPEQAVEGQSIGLASVLVERD
jgi:hypothetical protein